MKIFFNDSEDTGKYLRLLIDYGATPPSAQEINSTDWLLEATRYQQEEAIKFLLEHGGNPDLARRGGCPMTARQYAQQIRKPYFNSIPV